MTITVTAKAFDVKSSSETYVSLQNFAVPAISAEQMKISYSDPKPTKDFVGMGKAEGKVTFRDALGAVTGILSINSSIRADVSETDRTAMLALITALGGDAKFIATVKRGQIPFNG